MSSEAQESRHPQSKTELFMVFTFLALQGFGGVLAVVQRELVERRKWMTKVQFVEEWSVAQVMPGPNVVNLCLMIGGKYFGVAGALAAVGGLICGPLVLVLGLAILFGGVADNAVAQGALKAMGRADLIGNGKHHLIPTWQPLSDDYQSARRKNSTPSESASPKKGTMLTQHTGLPPRKKS